MDPLSGCEPPLEPAAAPAPAAAGPNAPAAHHSPDGDGPLTSAIVWLAIRDSARVVITALLLAFFFRAFFVEPFIIPTGSMAPGLLGQHWTGMCPRCGFELLVNASDDNGSGPPAQVACGNCRAWLPSAGIVHPSPGDRILVHKWPFELSPPKRWDVIVFRDPVDPQTNYIKRVVALPGEEVEIRAGDVYINGRIARKPEFVQRGMWIPVFDQRYVPVPSDQGVLRWMAGGPGQAGWSGLDERVLRFMPQSDGPGTLYFGSHSGEYSTDFFAYNSRSTSAPVRDIRICADVEWGDSAGTLGVTLRLYPWTFSLELGADGKAKITYSTFTAEGTPEDRVDQLALPRTAGPLQVELQHVDQQVVVKFGGRESWSCDLSSEQAMARAYAMGREASAAAFELVADAGPIAVRNLRIDRDVYYTESRRSRRALPDDPFRLEDGEYFVLGDNSPDSHDAREWEAAGIHMGPDYRIGTVPARQIVGRAALVYLPGLRPRQSWGLWPALDLGRVRFVR
jgi:signal peptidase I